MPACCPVRFRPMFEPNLQLVPIPTVFVAVVNICVPSINAVNSLEVEIVSNTRHVVNDGEGLPKSFRTVLPEPS